MSSDESSSNPPGADSWHPASSSDVPTAEPQLPIIEHKSYLGFDSSRAQWERLSPDERTAAVDKARSLVERQTQWWADRPNKERNNVYSWTNTNIFSAGLLLRLAGQEDEANRYIAQARDRFYSQVRNNIYQDGSSLDFHNRDSVRYHIFNGVAWLKCASYLHEAGELIPTDITDRLRDSVEFARPYIDGTTQHLEFVNSQNPRDKLRHPDVVGRPFSEDTYKYYTQMFMTEASRIGLA